MATYYVAKKNQTYSFDLARKLDVLNHRKVLDKFEIIQVHTFRPFVFGFLHLFILVGKQFATLNSILSGSC